MLGNKDNLKAKNENKGDHESFYGGFGSRFSYERCVNGGSSVGIVKRVLFFAGIAMLVLSFGLLCAAVLFRMVAVNSSLYFPNGNHIGAGSSDTSVKRAAVTAAAHEEAASLASVSFEDSQRYRVPTGVMVRTEDSCEALVPGLIPGDIITSVNGTEIYDVDSLHSALSESFGTESTRLTVFRENGYVIITMGADLCNASVAAE